MSFVSVVPKQVVQIHQDAFVQLENGVKKLNMDAPIEKEYIFELDEKYSTENGPAFIAIAKIDNTFVLYAPDYLTAKQMIVFDFHLSGVNENINICVLSKRDYDAVKRCVLGTMVDVKLIT